MPDRNRSGSLLFIVLAVVLIVAMLSTVILRIILSQTRLTHHQVSRIQSQYAVKAGILYALDKLRRGDDLACWPAAGVYTNTMRRVGVAVCDVVEPNLPDSILQVDITVDAPDPVSGVRTIRANTVYTYTP